MHLHVAGCCHFPRVVVSSCRLSFNFVPPDGVGGKRRARDRSACMLFAYSLHCVLQVFCASAVLIVQKSVLPHKEIHIYWTQSCNRTRHQFHSLCLCFPTKRSTFTGHKAVMAPDTSFIASRLQMSCVCLSVALFIHFVYFICKQVTTYSFVFSEGTNLVRL
jgi:hypothetical protein